MDLLKNCKPKSIYGREASIIFDAIKEEGKMTVIPGFREQIQERQNLYSEFQNLLKLTKDTPVFSAEPPKDAIFEEMVKVYVQMNGCTGYSGGVGYNGGIGYSGGTGYIGHSGYSGGMGYSGGTGYRGGTAITGLQCPEEYRAMDIIHPDYTGGNLSLCRNRFYTDCGCSFCKCVFTNGICNELWTQVHDWILTMPDYPDNVCITLDYGGTSEQNGKELEEFSTLRQILSFRAAMGKFDRVECLKVPVHKNLICRGDKVASDKLDTYQKQKEAIEMAKKSGLIDEDDEKLIISNELFEEITKVYVDWEGVSVKIYAVKGTVLYDLLYSEGIIRKAFKEQELQLKLKALIKSRLR